MQRPKGKRQVLKSLWPLEGGVSEAELRAGGFQKRQQEVASGVGPSPPAQYRFLNTPDVFGALEVFSDTRVLDGENFG